MGVDVGDGVDGYVGHGVGDSVGADVSDGVGGYVGGGVADSVGVGVGDGVDGCVGDGVNGFCRLSNTPPANTKLKKLLLASKININTS